jgi:hypothetical protein
MNRRDRGTLLQIRNELIYLVQYRKYASINAFAGHSEWLGVRFCVLDGHIASRFVSHFLPLST